MSRPPLDPRTLLARWSPGEWVIAVASLVMIAALFLDWTSVTCSDDTLCRLEPAGPVGIRGWGWLTFAGLLAVLCLLVVRTILADDPRLPGLRVSDSVLSMTLGGVELLGCFLFWFEYPSVTLGPTAIRPGVGWYVALVAAAATVAGGRLVRGARRPAEQLELFEDTVDDRAAHHPV